MTAWMPPPAPLTTSATPASDNCCAKLDDFVVHESRENLLLFLISLILLLPASACLQVVGIVLALDSRVGNRHWIRVAASGLVLLGILLQCVAIYLLINVRQKYRANLSQRRYSMSQNDPISPATGFCNPQALLQYPPAPQSLVSGAASLSSSSYATPPRPFKQPLLQRHELRFQSQPADLEDTCSTHVYTFPRHV